MAVAPIPILQVRRCRRLHRCAQLALLLMLGGCNGGPSQDVGRNLGNMPLKSRTDLLSQLELNADCNGLKLAMDRHAAEIRTLRAAMAIELTTPAPTLERMMQRQSGIEGGGTLNFDKIKLERLAMQAVNTQGETKHCAPIAIDQAVAGIQPSTHTVHKSY